MFNFWTCLSPRYCILCFWIVLAIINVIVPLRRWSKCKRTLGLYEFLGAIENMKWWYLDFCPAQKAMPMFSPNVNTPQNMDYSHLMVGNVFLPALACYLAISINSSYQYQPILINDTTNLGDFKTSPRWYKTLRNATVGMLSFLRCCSSSTPGYVILSIEKCSPGTCIVIRR